MTHLLGGVGLLGEGVLYYTIVYYCHDYHRGILHNIDEYLVSLN